MPQSSKQKIETLKSYLRKDPDDSFSKFALALEYRKMDKTREARVLFESIRENDPDYVGVYYHLGKLYQSLGNTDKARETFETGIKRARDNNEQHAASELEEAKMILETEE